MGEATISYWGWSYGTYLGYLYATLFPTRLRAAVLDGPVDPTLDLAGRDDGQARGFEAAFNRELALCAGSKTCPFYNGGDPAKAYAALMARLETAPIPVTGLGTLGPGEATTGVITSLYGGDPQTTMRALAEAQRGDGHGLLGMANAYYAQIQLGSYLATACLDVAREPTTAAIDQVLARTSAAAPRFAAQVVLTDAYGCLDWPVAADPVHVGAPPSGLPPILVLAATYDPATPPWGAEPLARALGTGVVVMRDGLGHTSDGSIRTNTCLGDAATSYLLGLVTPKPGLVCKDAPVTFGP
jgi:pimeloyl-ACP methyl ester carboxylesterase